MSAAKGFFISFEGVEGSGKSTHARMLMETLLKDGHEVIATAEPGGTPIGRSIRHVLLDPKNTAMDPLCELLLYNADRAQHISETIRPALKSGKVVITDRFSDSTVAYQHHAREIGLDTILELDRIAAHGLKPDLTFLLDLDISEGFRRNRNAGKSDRFELEQMEFHQRVREGFLKIAEKEPQRVVVLHAEGTKDELNRQIYEIVLQRL